MLTDLTAILNRSAGTLAEDALGLAALVVLLLGALSLPGFA
jgi:hypothetical protein